MAEIEADLLERGCLDIWIDEIVPCLRDTETGEIYKAYNGFTDDYNGKRYQSITDDMYTKAISGYIEK